MFRKTCVAFIALLGLSSCIVTDVKLPLDTDLNETKVHTKSGESTLQSVLWSVAWGDAGIQAAALDGGLRYVSHADQRVFSILGGLYYKYTTVVYGH